MTQGEEIHQGWFVVGFGRNDCKGNISSDFSVEVALVLDMRKTWEGSLLLQQVKMLLKLVPLAMK